MKIDQHTDPMAYQPDMEITSSAIMEQVLAARAAYDETVYTCLLYTSPSPRDCS